MMPGFKGFMDHFCSNISKYKEFNESDEPHLWEFPAEANKILSNLRKLIIMRCLRPDKLVPSVAKYVVDSLGESFLNPPPFDLPTIFRDSDNKIPLIFILSPGADPLNGLMKFAEAKKKSESIKTVSLGQGQGVKAEAAIREAQKAGNWVVL
jgi:dynein heavy chain